MKKKITGISLCLLLCLTACGKQAETVTDYGNGATSARAAADDKMDVSTESGSVAPTEQTESSGVRLGHTLSEWLGGTEFEWKSTFSVGTYPAEADVSFRIAKDEEDRQKLLEESVNNYPALETDTLPAWRATGIKPEDVREAETVQSFLGDTAKEVRGGVSYSGGDAENVVDVCRGFAGRSSSDREEAAQHFDDSTYIWASWVDEEDQFIHTYEGKYMGADYQLTIGYLEKQRQKVISFFPKNPAAIVGDPEIQYAETSENEGFMIRESEDHWEWKTLDELGLAANRTTKNLETLRKEGEQFLKEKLNCTLFDDELKIDNTSEIVFSKEGIDNWTMSGNVSGAIRNGYYASLNWQFGNQSILRGEDGNEGNQGEIWLTDQGVIGVCVYISYDFAECLSDQVEILPFDKAMTAMEQQIAENLDLSRVEGHGPKLIFQNLGIYYYPVKSPSNANEYIFVPAWSVDLLASGGNFYIGKIFLNATDGSLIYIHYYADDPEE